MIGLKWMSFLSLISALNVNIETSADGKCECWVPRLFRRQREQRKTHTDDTTQQTIKSKNKNNSKTGKQVAFKKPWKTIATVYVLAFHIQCKSWVMAFGSLLLCVVWIVFVCACGYNWVGEDFHESVCTDLPTLCWCRCARRLCHFFPLFFSWHTVNLHLVLIVVRCSAKLLVTFLSTLNMKCRVGQFQIVIYFIFNFVPQRDRVASTVRVECAEQPPMTIDRRSIGRFHHRYPPLRSGLVAYIS